MTFLNHSNLYSPSGDAKECCKNNLESFPVIALMVVFGIVILTQVCVCVHACVLWDKARVIQFVSLRIETFNVGETGYNCKTDKV